MSGTAPGTEGLENDKLNGGEPEGRPDYEDRQGARRNTKSRGAYEGEEQESTVDGESCQADGKSEYISPFASENGVTPTPCTSATCHRRSAERVPGKIYRDAKCDSETEETGGPAGMAERHGFH